MVKCLESQENKLAPLNGHGSADSIINNHNINGSHVNGNNNDEDDDEWKEVGKKNRALVTRRVNFKFFFRSSNHFLLFFNY